MIRTIVCPRSVKFYNIEMIEFITCLLARYIIDIDSRVRFITINANDRLTTKVLIRDIK